MTRHTARRSIDAPAACIFDLLVSPGEHHRFDASTMVGDAVTPARLGSVGEVFTMEMTYTGGGETEHYRTDNHVTALEDEHLVEWEVAPHGEQPLGWRWRYELEPGGPARTWVALTYDWSGTPEENLRRYGVPLFDKDELAASLARLATAAEDA